MTTVYILAGLSLLIVAIVWISIRYGKKDFKADQAEEALKRAKTAKDTDGSNLGDKWMRFRD